MKARVESALCIGSGMCVLAAPGVFELDDDGVSHVVNLEAGNEESLREAAEGCPVEAIVLEDEEGNQLFP